MQVDRLVILYRDVGSNDAESVGSANALAAKFSARLARLAQEKFSDEYRKKAGKVTRVHKVGFSVLRRNRASKRPMRQEKA